MVKNLLKNALICMVFHYFLKVKYQNDEIAKKKFFAKEKKTYASSYCVFFWPGSGVTPTQVFQISIFEKEKDF